MTKKNRKLRYVGTADEVDMRPVVGLAGKETDEALKFIFYPVGSKIDPAAGNRQAFDGVEVTENQALAILTSPYRVWGFADITDDPSGATPEQFAEQTGTVVAFLERAVPPLAEPDGTVAGGYAVAPVIVSPDAPTAKDEAAGTGKRTK